MRLIASLVVLCVFAWSHAIASAEPLVTSMRGRFLRLPSGTLAVYVSDQNFEPLEFDQYKRDIRSALEQWSVDAPPQFPRWKEAGTVQSFGSQKELDDFVAQIPLGEPRIYYVNDSTGALVKSHGETLSVNTDAFTLPVYFWTDRGVVLSAAIVVTTRRSREDKANFSATMLHETGHAFGLGHGLVQSSVDAYLMSPRPPVAVMHNVGPIKTALHPNDVLWRDYLYAGATRVAVIEGEVRFRDGTPATLVNVVAVPRGGSPESLNRFSGTTGLSYERPGRFSIPVHPGEYELWAQSQPVVGSRANRFIPEIAKPAPDRRGSPHQYVIWQKISEQPIRIVRGVIPLAKPLRVVPLLISFYR